MGLRFTPTDADGAGVWNWEHDSECNPALERQIVEHREWLERARSERGGDPMSKLNFADIIQSLARQLTLFMDRDIGQLIDVRRGLGASTDRVGKAADVHQYTARIIAGAMLGFQWAPRARQPT